MIIRRALLFLNGQPPATLPDNLSDYTIIACTDGAYSSYLNQTSINIDYIIGDLDSLKQQDIKTRPIILHTPDQSKTDFEKALLFLISSAITHVDIYGATYQSSDHFLGNLSVARSYYKNILLRFYDDYSYFFFADPETHLYNVKSKTISIMPFISASNVTLKGFAYPLNNVNLTLGKQVSLRNQAAENNVSIYFQSGDLLIFINH